METRNQSGGAGCGGHGTGFRANAWELFIETIVVNMDSIPSPVNHHPKPAGIPITRCCSPNTNVLLVLSVTSLKSQSLLLTQKDAVEDFWISK